MRQYFVNGNTIERRETSIVVPVINYDSVVDRSTFSIESDRENARKSLVSGGSSVGVYDTDVENVSELAVKVRSGKFDKAEISKIQRGLREDMKKQLEADKKAAADKAAADLAKARQDYLDKETGFKGSPVEE